MEEIREQFSAYMIRQGLRRTAERFKILEHICRFSQHFDVNTLHRQMEEDNFHVSRASIYNTIELLMEARLLVRHQFSSQIVHYEIKTYASTHSHAICTYCGTIKEIKNDKIDKLIKEIKMTKFTIEYHSTYIYGMCSKCKFRLMKEKKTNYKDLI